MDTLKSGQPPYNGQTVRSQPFIVHAFLPLKKGQPLNNGPNARPQCPLFGGSTVLFFESSGQCIEKAVGNKVH